MRVRLMLAWGGGFVKSGSAHSNVVGFLIDFIIQNCCHVLPNFLVVMSLILSLS